MLDLLPARDRLKIFLQDSPVRAKKSLGQNFLVSDHVINAIFEEAQQSECQQMIEIGPGPGALTDGLIKICKDFTVIELDKVFAEHWRKKGITVIEQDALQLSWEQITRVPQSVLVSNLPYQISSSLVIDRSIMGDGPDRMILMFQKEVAQRIRAKPSTPAYGLLSVIAQTFWEIKTVIDAGPRDFSPPPKVASRVLSFNRLPNPVPDRKLFLQFCKAAFAQRRKLLVNNLGGTFCRFHKKDTDAIAWLDQHGHSEKARAEELSPSKFVDLYLALAK